MESEVSPLAAYYCSRSHANDMEAYAGISGMRRWRAFYPG